MEAAKICSECGSPVPNDAPGGYCPGCMIGAVDFPEDHSEPFAVEAATDGIRRIGDYELGRQIGSGGMGVVYEAEQCSLHRKVAIKLIRNSETANLSQLRRFTIEAEAAARLNHPNIVPIHEVGE